MTDAIDAIFVIIGLVILFLLPNFKLVKQNEVKIIERLGKFHKVLDQPGIYLIVPLIDRDIQTVSLEKEHIKSKVTVKTNDIETELEISYDMTVIDPMLYVYSALDANKEIHTHIKNQLEEQISYEEIIDETMELSVQFGFKIEKLNLK